MQLKDVKGKVDFGIITILEEEFAAVLDRFPPEGRVTGQRHYNLRKVPLPGGGFYRVAVLRCIEQGNGEAQSAARDLLEDLAPHWLLVVGIAGGVPSDDFGLGDVVVSTRIHDFSLEAVLQDKGSEYSLAGGPMEKSAAALAANLPALQDELGDWHSAEAVGLSRPDIDVESAASYGDEHWRKRIRASLKVHASRKSPLVVAGPIASSDRLIKDTNILTVWTKVARHVLAIEMESAGVYRATYGRQVPTLSIRGISDVVGHARETGWKKYACHTAAAFAFALMRTLPFPPGSHSSEGAHEERLRSLVAQYPFPRVQDADPYHVMGVTESELASQYASEDARPPYVMRDVDAELDKALTTSDLVLLIGHSKAGKSRTAYEAAVRLYPLHPLIIPSNGEALAELFRLEPPLQWNTAPAIIWLDDLQRFLGPEGLTVSLLNKLAQKAGRVKLLATLTSKRHEDYLRSTSDVDKGLQLLLRRFREVHISSELSPGEALRAQNLYPDEPREQLADGLGEHFVAAHELRRKYDTAKASCPQGHALVRAAVDWRRAGMLRPVPEGTLQQLAAQYMSFLRLSHVDMTQESFQAGLQWARQPVALHVALLSKTGEDGAEKHFEAFDYIIDYTDRREMSISDAAWEAILRFASPAEAVVVAVSAYQRRNLAIFQKALDQAIQSGDPQVVSRALYVLGLFRQEEGRLSEAEVAYRQGLALGETTIAPHNKVALGILLQNRAEQAEAERLYREVIASNEPEAVALATLNLGLLLQNQRKPTEAESLYRRALDSGQPEVVALAANNLGTLYQREGKRVEAEHWFQQAAESRYPNASVQAFLNLGKLAVEAGDLDKAERIYSRIANSDNPRDSARSSVNLGQIHYLRGNLAEAERLYRRVIATNEPEVMGHALNNLGQLLLARGDSAEAERLFRQTIESKPPDAADLGRANLGLVLQSRGELEQAEKLYRQALSSMEPVAAGLAANNLGLILESRGELEEAKRFYQQAIDSGGPDAIPLAFCNLGSLLQDEEALDAAVPLLRRALQFKKNAGTLKAQFCLGTALVDLGQHAEAERHLRAVVDANEPDLSPRAAFALGSLYNDEDRYSEAEQVLRLAMQPGNHPLARLATLQLGIALGQQGNLTTAEPCFQSVFDSKPDELHYLAAASLGFIRALRGDPAEAERLFRLAIMTPQEEVKGSFQVQLARLLLGKGAIEEAIPLLKAALASSDDDAVTEARAVLAEAGLPENDG